ncbi:MAG: GNAT family N-acetyltransferase [Flavobacteriales bacterium]|jgi:ribosomal-protein-alanine N-acetyltransferase|tara:strand:+ start:290 stop:829 length:540 start_codon:yes stop_codon:yes gene_type:complete
MKTTLTSSRLTLTLASLKDLAFIHELQSFPQSAEFNTLGVPENEEVTRKATAIWEEHHAKIPIEQYHFLISEQDSPVGLIGLKLGAARYRRGEVWYTVHPKHWGKGIATEALNLMLDLGFDHLKLHRIQAGCAVGNLGSIKVLEKVGMIKEGRGRQILPLSTGWSDNYEYSILESDPRK